ncbi:MAG: ACT domain-containing protein [Firmicutes bacterium]|nr:ACT domain-containing protein [Bacillota bacterium]
MKAVITVIGKDKIGIISKVTTVLSKEKVNILDISQTILQDYFTMLMLVDLTKLNISLNQLNNILNKEGKKVGVSVKIQHEDIFNAMHKL